MKTNNIFSKLNSKIKQFFKSVKESTELPVNKHRKYFFIVSGAIIFIGLMILIIFGFNLGLDFTGGTIITVRMGEELETTSIYNQNLATIEDILTQNGLTLSSSQKQGEGTDSAIVVKYQDIAGYTDEEMNTLGETVMTQIEEALNAEHSAGFRIDDTQRIGATSSGELLLYAMLALLATMVLVLIYLAIRFELVSGLVTLMVLVHDVLIMSALVLVFQIQINSPFIAAIITIAGYSINNTIIVFDRIRENRATDKYKDYSHARIADKSVKDMLTRTMYTSFTTIIVILILAIIGVSAIREFALPIIFGLVSGVYSSTCIAPSLWALIMDKREEQKNKKPNTIVVKAIDVKPAE